jgi:hypothetical protein
VFRSRPESIAGQPEQIWGNTVGADASGKTRRDWVAFGHGEYITTKIVLGIPVATSVLSGEAFRRGVVLRRDFEGLV